LVLTAVTVQSLLVLNLVRKDILVIWIPLFFLLTMSEVSTLPPIQQLNNESRDNFLAVVNTLFETAPPLADKLLAARPYSSYLQLIERGQDICLGNELSESEKLEVINAHPRIGESSGKLSAMSLKEQGYKSAQQAISPEDQAVNERLAVMNKVRNRRYSMQRCGLYTD
jgi:2-oxo-4-hydroxy-4-carboxy--5-ureidoimidazoline (OHCU) decarboxylase